MSIDIEHLSRHFGAFCALDDVSLWIPGGELTALLGPSGSGKTTLLRIIAGLEMPDEGAGEIRFHGHGVARTPAGERRVGFVFQHYALFPHMSVFENVAFGLRIRPRRSRPSETAIRRKVMALLELVHLDGMAERDPAQLSGGQRQRVALARALAIEPQVLLLDEPFGALDAQVRMELRRWLRRLHDELHVTSVFVTHDQEEALEVADRVVVMNRGRIEQVGTPDDVFHRPASEFVMSFIGQVNCLQGRVANGALIIGDAAIPVEGVDGENATARVFVRPHEMAIEPVARELKVVGDDEAETAQPAGLAAVVRFINTAGAIARVELDTPDHGMLMVDVPMELVTRMGLRKGEQVRVRPLQVRRFRS